MATLKIKEPRYHDKTVLLAKYKITDRNKVIILNGAYAGNYTISKIAVTSYPINSNGSIDCYAVPLSKLTRIE